MVKTYQFPRKFAKSTNQTAHKTALLPNFDSFGNKHGRYGNRAVCTNMKSSNLLTEQTVASPLLKENQNLQIRDPVVLKVASVSRPVKRTQKG